MSRIVKIYSLSDPLTNEVRYVGKTIESLDTRLSRHLRRKDKTYRSKWIQSLKSKNVTPTIEIIDYCNESDWEWIEIYWISQFKTWGFKLTNLCDGGLGSTGMKHTEESIQKMRIASMGNKNKLGKPVSQETRNKISNSQKGKKLSNEHKSKISKSLIGNKFNLGKKFSNEHKLKIKINTIKKIGKPIIQYDRNMNYICEWDAISLASDFLNIPDSNIVNVCKGNRKSAGNYIFKYK